MSLQRDLLDKLAALEAMEVAKKEYNKEIGADIRELRKEIKRLREEIMRAEGFVAMAEVIA